MADPKPFDPSDFAVVVEPSAVSLRPELQDGAVLGQRAHLIPWEEIGEDPMESVDASIATIEWDLVRFSAVTDAGRDPFDFADEVSGDLLEVARILFDDEGALREFAGAAGNELLYFTAIDVEPEFDFFKVAVELLEHVIGVRCAGCFGAAYYRDETPRLELERALRDRGFALVPNEKLFFVSLELRRPGLPGAE
jgi:hypothetical protein